MKAQSAEKTFRSVVTVTGTLITLGAIVGARNQAGGPNSGIGLMFDLFVAAFSVAPYILYFMATKTRPASVIAGVLMLCWTFGSCGTILLSPEGDAGLGFITFPFVTYGVSLAGIALGFFLSRRTPGGSPIS